MINLSINDISMNDISMNDISMNDFISMNDISMNISMNDKSHNNIIYNDNYLKYKNKLIVITVFLIIVESVILLRIDKQVDKMILHLAIYGQILLLFSLNMNKPILIEISHMIFGACILLILCFSKDLLMNLLCYNVY